MHFKLPQKGRDIAEKSSSKKRRDCGLPAIACNPHHHSHALQVNELQITLAPPALQTGCNGPLLHYNQLAPEFPHPLVAPEFLHPLVPPELLHPLGPPEFLHPLVALEFLHPLGPPEFLHPLVPSGSWAAAGPPWRACAAAPAPGACCTPAGWWARSGAASGSARSASSGWCWDGGTPAPAWTRADAAAWHAPGPSVSAFCLAPSRRTEGIIRFFVLTWISVDKVTFHFVCKGISLSKASEDRPQSFLVLSAADSNATGNFSFLISLFFFLF